MIDGVNIIGFKAIIGTGIHFGVSIQDKEPDFRSGGGVMHFTLF